MALFIQNYQKHVMDVAQYLAFTPWDEIAHFAVRLLTPSAVHLEFSPPPLLLWTAQPSTELCGDLMLHGHWTPQHVCVLSINITDMDERLPFHCQFFHLRDEPNPRKRLFWLPLRDGPVQTLNPAPFSIFFSCI